jgi:hypothetical protein
MYTVQYYCSRQAELGWQGNGQAATSQDAIKLAYAMKPPHGQARILNANGVVIYKI